MHLYSRPLNVTYHANRFSCASCCTLLYVICLIVLPYITVYSLGGMWTKESLVREQPLVRFRYEVLVEAQASTASQPILPLAWSTSQELNDALGSSLRPCKLQAWEEDDELDGYPDRLQFVVTVPVAEGERVHAASVLLGVDVQFQREFQLRMNSSLRLEASSPLPGASWRQTADLTLRSNHPQRSLDLQPRSPCSDAEGVWALREPQLADGSAASAASILGMYERCNDTATLAAQPPIWTPGLGRTFEARLTVRVPSQLTTRRPGLLETVKLAAVQYIAFFFPISFLLTCVHSALFRWGIVATRVHHPVKQHKF